jgi:hypothetical protein
MCFGIEKNNNKNKTKNYNIKNNFEMVSNISKLQKKWFLKNFVIPHTKIKFNFFFNGYTDSAYP